MNTKEKTLSEIIEIMRNKMMDEIGIKLPLNIPYGNFPSCDQFVWVNNVWSNKDKEFPQGICDIV